MSIENNLEAYVPNQKSRVETGTQSNWVPALMALGIVAGYVISPNVSSYLSQHGPFAYDATPQLQNIATQQEKVQSLNSDTSTRNVDSNEADYLNKLEIDLSSDISRDVKHKERTFTPWIMAAGGALGAVASIYSIKPEEEVEKEAQC